MTLDEAVKLLGESAKKLGDTADTFDRAAASLLSVEKEAKRERDRGERDADGPKRNRLQRIWDQTRPGRQQQATQANVGRAMGGTGAGGTGDIGGLGKGIARAAGVVGVVVGVGQALNDFRKSIQQTTAAQLQHLREMGQFHGGMAAVFAQQDVRNLLRDMKKSDQVLDSTKRLSEAEGRRKDATAPFETALDNAKNGVLSWLNDRLTGAATKATEYTNKIIEGINRLVPPGKEIPLLKPLEEPKDMGLKAALEGPGGLLEKAKEAEGKALAGLAKAKDIGKGLGGAAVKPVGKLP